MESRTVGLWQSNEIAREGKKNADPRGPQELGFKKRIKRRLGIERREREGEHQFELKDVSSVLGFRASLDSGVIAHHGIIVVCHRRSGGRGGGGVGAERRAERRRRECRIYTRRAAESPSSRLFNTRPI